MFPKWFDKLVLEHPGIAYGSIVVMGIILIAVVVVSEFMKQ